MTAIENALCHAVTQFPTWTAIEWIQQFENYLGLVKNRAVNTVRSYVLDVELLHRFVNPLTGGPEGRGWPFDSDLNAATLAQLLEAVDGVDRVEEVLLFEYDLRTGERTGIGREVIRLDARSLFLSAGHQVVVR